MMLRYHVIGCPSGPWRSVAIVTTTDSPPPKADDVERVVRPVVIVFELFRLARWIIAFGGTALILYIAIALPLKYTAGKETTISLIYKVILDARLEVILPYVLAAVFAGLWERERRIRKHSVQREHERVVELERRINANRTSSGLEE